MEKTDKLNAVSTSVLAFTSVIGVGAALVYYFKELIKPVYLIVLMATYFLAVELFVYRIWKVIK